MKKNYTKIILLIFIFLPSLLYFYRQQPDPLEKQNKIQQLQNVPHLLQKKNFSPQKNSFQHLGDHIIAEFTGCTNLNNNEKLESILRKSAKAAGATVLSVTIHTFEPQGMTGVAVLAESHISVHTWPECGYCSIDIYTCGVHVEIEKALTILQDFFQPNNVDAISIQRGF